MTLKSKLAILNNLAAEEDRIKAEIEDLQTNIQDVELRQYNIAELRKKYSTLDFTNITQRQLSDLMASDFRESNLTELEQREIYEHNMKILEQVLEKTKRQNEHISRRCFNSIDDARKAIHVNKQNRDCRTIEIRGKAADELTAGYDTDELEEHFDEEFIAALNNLIDKEYQFALKILKTYCIFCHYRDIKLPSQTELDEIKEDLEGWQFVPKEDFKKIEYNEELYYLVIKNFKIVLQTGRFRSLSNWGIKCYNSINNCIVSLNKLNPIFRKITEDDIIINGYSSEMGVLNTF
jgi:hypothetical protein